MGRYRLVGSGTSARPAPKKLAPFLNQLERETGSGYTSLLRTQAAVTYARKHGAALSSQAELYQGYVTGQPGYNPANPPGRSTHERRSDGVAYPGPIGRPLRWWQCGIDCKNSEATINQARKHGWICVRPYSSASEWHHINFMKQPRLGFRNLKRGSRGRRVTKLERRLKYLGYGKDLKVDRHFGAKTQAAVKRFQRKRGLKVDGIVGPHTWKQLTVDFRREWKRRK